jgi:hypothetical protein
VHFDAGRTEARFVNAAAPPCDVHTVPARRLFRGQHRKLPFGAATPERWDQMENRDQQSDSAGVGSMGLLPSSHQLP